MNDYSFKLANYWRNSLADAENGNGALSTSQAQKLTALPIEVLFAGCVPAEQVSLLFANEPAELPCVKITLRPLVYKSRLEHRKARNGLPAFITPVVCRVLVARDGRLYPTSQTLMPRDILEPLDRDNFAIGAQVDVDAFLSAEDVPQFDPSAEGEELAADQHRDKWNAYLQFCMKMFRKVTSGWEGADDGFDLVNFCYLFKEDKAEGFSRNIVCLYDHLRDNKPDAPLFDRFAQRDSGKTNISVN